MAKNSFVAEAEVTSKNDKQSMTCVCIKVLLQTHTSLLTMFKLNFVSME